MPTYQAFSDFTAQSRNVTALMVMYAQLEREPEVRMELTPIVVFMAFSIESYLNSVGSKAIPFWDELERLPWKQKISILHQVAKQNADWGREPLQFASEVFRIRDRLAHGKTERVVGPIVDDSQVADRLSLQDGLLPKWYREITKPWVLQAKERFRILMSYLGALHGLHESDHLLTATGGIIVRDGDDA